MGLIHVASWTPSVVCFCHCCYYCCWNEPLGLILDHLRQVSVLPINDDLSFIRRLPVQILQLPQKPESLWSSLLCPNETRYYLHRGEPRCLKACGRRHWASRVRDQDTQMKMERRFVHNTWMITEAVSMPHLCLPLWPLLLLPTQTSFCSLFTKVNMAPNFLMPKYVW